MPREVDRALASGARIVGLNNRDLRTLVVDPDRASRLRELVPDDRLVVAESGVREPAQVARWRAQGFDAALVGEALVRAADPASAVRAFVAAGRQPDDPSNVARRPFVKICGDHRRGRGAGRRPLRRGRDRASTWCPGTPRALSLPEAADLARLRPCGRRRRPTRPRIVAVTVDLGRRRSSRAIVRRARPRRGPVERHGTRRPRRPRRDARSGRSCISPPSRPPDPARVVGEVVSRGRAFLDAGATRILLDTAGGPHPGGTGVARGRGPGRAGRPRTPGDARRRSRRRPTSPRRCGPIPATGVDVASGVEAPRVAGERPTKDAFRVALFVKRARAARDDRPDLPFGPTPVHAGLLEADAAGRWGMERDFGGRYVPETLMAALEQLETAYDALRHDPASGPSCASCLATFAGRPTPLYRADRLADAVRTEAARLAVGAATPAVRPPRSPVCACT